jgi:hypothetical protein
MSSCIIEGESFFVLRKLHSIIKNKKVEFNPETVSQGFSLLENPDYYIFIDPDKDTCEQIKISNFIICFMDKNVDLRLDYIKQLKKRAEFFSFEPIPTTDFASLKNIFGNLDQGIQNYPSKKVNLKYKNAKQNYEWFDLCLIDDLLKTKDPHVFNSLNESYFDIWLFMDYLWANDSRGLNQIQYINNENFEEYFNRIRETLKDYLEVLQTGAKTFSEHKKALPNSVINHEFRFMKVKEKLRTRKNKNILDSLHKIDECLKNVRTGSNAKLEMLKLFSAF